MNVFELLSIFDWITPAIETGKDIAYTVETRQIGCPISSRDLDNDRRKLEQAGIQIISTTRGWNESFIDVPNSQAAEAIKILGEK